MSGVLRVCEVARRQTGAVCAAGSGTELAGKRNVMTVPLPLGKQAIYR